MHKTTITNPRCRRRQLVVYSAVFLLALLPTFMPVAFGASATASSDLVFVWHKASMDAAAAREDGALQAAKESLLAEAEGALHLGPFSVTEKTRLPPSGDPHDFCTLSPYFWPTPFLPNGKPYYFRDGKVNPESKSDHYDRERLFAFMRTLRTLALAYRFHGDERFATRAAELLRVWFLNPETAMNPNLNYAQAIPGWTKGSSLGVIRGSELLMILDGSRLITKSPAWTKADEAGLLAWYSRYLDWVTSSDFGHRDGRRKNNHGTWHDVHIAAMALYVGRDSIARDILTAAPEYRLLVQIRRDGGQKYELRRSRSWEYSLYNLRGLYALAEIGDHMGVDLWNYEKDGFNPLREATALLIPYAQGKAEWEHSQLDNSNAWALEMGAHVFNVAPLKFGPDFAGGRQFLKELQPADRLRLLYNMPVLD